MQNPTELLLLSESPEDMCHVGEDGLWLGDPEAGGHEAGAGRGRGAEVHLGGEGGGSVDSRHVTDVWRCSEWWVQNVDDEMGMWKRW